MIGATVSRVGIVALLLGVGVMVSGCANNCTGNPNTDSLGCAMVNQDIYADQTNQANRRADDAELRADQERRRYDDTNEELVRVRSERHAIERRLSRADRELALLEGQLRARRAALSDAEYRLRQTELERLKAERDAIASAGGEGVERDIQALEEDVKSLKKILED